MSSSQDELAELERQVQQIRNKRTNPEWAKRTRNVLNVLFLILAAVGVILFYVHSDNHIVGMSVIGAGMIIKIAEFILRFIA